MRVSEYLFAVQRTVDRLSRQYPDNEAIRQASGRASRAVGLMLDGQEDEALAIAERIAHRYGLDDDEGEPCE